MDNKVVTTVARAMLDLGAATWRFNFRGTGQSEGAYDHGKGEVADLAAVVAHARAQYPGLPVWLCGFSFGAFVSICAAQQLTVDRLLSIAPPAGKWDFSGLAEPQMSWWVVQGEQDEVIAPEAVYQWLDSLLVKPTLIRMPEASHFFHGLLLPLREHIMQAWR